MQKNTIRKAAALAGIILLTAGCSRPWTMETDGSEIRFTAGSTLLRTDTPSTKFGGLMADTEFSLGSHFRVWGAEIESSARHSVFSGVEVTLEEVGAYKPYGDVWRYSPLAYWNPDAKYDFLAISGLTSYDAIACDPTAPEALTATVSYCPTAEQHDILAAGYQRANSTTTPVHFQFQHILSAVSVTVYNDSPAIPVKLNAYNFRGICTNADGKVQPDVNGLRTVRTSSWSPLTYTAEKVLGFTAGPNSSPTIEVASRFPETAQWDLMIPQSLIPDGEHIPQLYLDYEYDQVNPYTGQMEHNHSQFPINLETINVKNSDGCITSWEPGKQYTYEIHIRLGGGITVNVSVTDWQEIHAETPGLTIS